MNLRRVGLLATRYTMEDPFYRDLLAERFGIEAIVPEEPARIRVHDIICEELCRVAWSRSSRKDYLRIIDELAARGAEGIVTSLHGDRNADRPGRHRNPALRYDCPARAQAAVTWAIDGPGCAGSEHMIKVREIDHVVLCA